MREIKFRAWDTLLKKYTYSGFGEKTFNIFVKRVNCSRYIIEQYTELKDKYGKEIYEGDIVKFTVWWFDGNECSSELTGEIVYSEENMSFQLKGIKNKEWEAFTGYVGDSEYLTPFSELNFGGADFSIIGNIRK
jgi:uncharacterized phage protein (TIGR01671 family)